MTSSAPNPFPVITANKLAHLRYIYEHGSFMFYTYKGNHFSNVDTNFTKATLNYLWQRGLITQIFDNYFGDIWDISAFGALVLSHHEPDYQHLDLHLLFKRVQQPYEVWVPNGGLGIFEREGQVPKESNNVVEMLIKEGGAS